MKNLCNILILVLALIVFNLGAGAGMEHICSAYCKTQACSSSTHHSCNDTKSCFHHSDNDTSDTSVSEGCSCINVHYNIDCFLKISHEDDVVSSIQMPLDLPEHISYITPPVSAGLLFSQAPNAPPVINGGRTLLAYHSVLII